MNHFINNVDIEQLFDISYTIALLSIDNRAIVRFIHTIYYK